MRREGAGFVPQILLLPAVIGLALVVMLVLLLVRSSPAKTSS